MLSTVHHLPVVLAMVAAVLRRTGDVDDALPTGAAQAGPHREFLAQCLARRACLVRADAMELPDLTPRERELLGLLRSSLELTEIAAALGISLNTLNPHRRSSYRKIGARNRREAVRLADFGIGRR